MGISGTRGVWGERDRGVGRAALRGDGGGVGRWAWRGDKGIGRLGGGDWMTLDEGVSLLVRDRDVD